MEYDVPYLGKIHIKNNNTDWFKGCYNHGYFQSLEYRYPKTSSYHKTNVVLRMVVYKAW